MKLYQATVRDRLTGRHVIEIQIRGADKSHARHQASKIYSNRDHRISMVKEIKI